MNEELFDLDDAPAHDVGWIADDTGNRYRFVPKTDTGPVEKFTVRVADLSKDQKKVYDEVCSWITSGSRRTLTVGGYAGTGKSTVVSVFANEHCDDYRIAFCAFTGKAANVLRTKLAAIGARPAFVGTIHKLIYKPKLNSRQEIIGWARAPELPYDLIVVDEASMVNEVMYRDLESYGVPICAVGDHGQLPPIEGKFNLMEDPMLRLERIHRQAEGNPIIALASYIREHGELPTEYDSSSEHIRLVEKSKLRDVLRGAYAAAGVGECPPMSEIAMLTYTNANRRSANLLAREVLKRDPKVDVAPDEHLVCLRNCFQGVVSNGMRAQVTAAAAKERNWFDVSARFDDDPIEIQAKMFRHQFGAKKTIAMYDEVERYGITPFGWQKQLGLLFDYGYCLTVHKSQGSSFKDVYLLYERPRMVEPEDFKRWLYTAVTRSSWRLNIVAGMR